LTAPDLSPKHSPKGANAGNAHRAKPAVVYITYDGLLEPLGESQVVAYMKKLAAEWQIHIVSFEKKADRENVSRMSDMRSQLTAAGIKWTPLAYHKSPTVPATAFDITHGAVVASWLAFRHKAAIVHARSYVPGLMALAVKKLTGAKLLFDIRGFWADERVDGGIWPKDGRLYRGAKKCETLLLKSADQIVTLTNASVREIASFPYFKGRSPALAVIPTCADLNRFKPHGEPSKEPFVFGYVGTVGTWYLLDEIVAFYVALARRLPDARMLFVNRGEHDAIRAKMSEHGVAPDRYEIVAAEHRDVPKHISRMHAAAAIIKPAYSKIASAPTKFAEYLGCGVPCVGNIRVGDMEELLEGKRVGVALHDFSKADIEITVDRLLALLDDPELRNRCMATAQEIFSLESGVAKYRSLYLRLSGADQRAATPANNPIAADAVISHSQPSSR